MHTDYGQQQCDGGERAEDDHGEAALPNRIGERTTERLYSEEGQ